MTGTSAPDPGSRRPTRTLGDAGSDAGVTVRPSAADGTIARQGAVAAGTDPADDDDAGALFGGVPAVVARLRDVATVRRRSADVLAAVRTGSSPHFRLDEGRAADVAGRIAAITRSRFPDLVVPYHSRWRHFEAGGLDRKAEVDRALSGHSREARARACIELALVSVLLDAGAGPDWRYREAQTGLTLTRSEGLAVAGLRAFLAGAFSSDDRDRCRVDAAALAGVDAARLAEIFQVDEGNPLVGIEGRASLLRRLADALRAHPRVFGGDGRPGRLFDALTLFHGVPLAGSVTQGHGVPLTGSVTSHQQGSISAPRLLRALLDAFSPIWPSGQVLEVDGNSWPLGDAWRHPAAGAAADDAGAGWLPFHKLSQWLAYSLVEPFEWAGVRVTHLLDAANGLTGLPEYRNGGLLLDAGLVVPRASDWAASSVTPADPWVIEWRALTVALLDDLAPLVRERLAAGRPRAIAERARSLPLACLLEGGSWAAGRAIAAERRPGGPPPVTVVSDGTVF
jgi:hypothetical protein